MRKKLLPVLILALLGTAGCGSASKNDYYSSGGHPASDVSYKQDYAAEEAGGGIFDVAGDVASSNDISAANDVTATVNREMLIYRGSLYIDTLDFNRSVGDFKSLINAKGGFVETEYFTDNSGKNGYYAVDDADKHNVYTATVRIPSTEYEAVMNQSANLGDVRSKNSTATNVTQQYGTYKAQLEIYEAEYARYLALLEQATDDEYALMIENNLFDIQIQIATLKSGITNLENDVAYSYIDIEIREVTKYQEEPEKTDTFFDRLKNTCRHSWSSFLNFLERILFFLIDAVYYVVIIAVIVLIIRLIAKKKKSKNGEKIRKAKAPAAQPPYMGNGYFLQEMPNTTGTAPLENIAPQANVNMPQESADAAQENVDAPQENINTPQESADVAQESAGAAQENTDTP